MPPDQHDLNLARPGRCPQNVGVFTQEIAQGSMARSAPLLVIDGEQKRLVGGLYPSAPVHPLSQLRQIEPLQSPSPQRVGPTVCHEQLAFDRDIIRLHAAVTQRERLLKWLPVAVIIMRVCGEEAWYRTCLGSGAGGAEEKGAE
jgi:hypothetical protein